MKKRISLIIAMLCAITCMAEEHLKFKGIPIEGSMKSFCQKLANKGFTKIGSDSNLTLFTGDFTGRDATIGVKSDDDGENVYSVIVLFESSKEWKVLVSTYNYYKDLYTRKYGEPKISKEINTASNTNNALLMIELEERNAIWGSIWEVPGGEIEISIEKTEDVLRGAVSIRYRDTQNEEAKIQKYLEDI